MYSILFAFLAFLLPTSLAADPADWAREWPRTDFSKASVDLGEIFSGGPPKDGIPAIDKPEFAPTGDVELPGIEPVIGLTVNGVTRAYPLRILMWHEIVNDELAGVPVSVTFCPLCNTGIVFDRRLDGQTLDFGTTGKLRNSDLVMYDRQTESWWQQFLGEAIAGELTGSSLAMIPARLESYADLQRRAPDAEVLLPPTGVLRDYGSNPYVGYDSLARPFLYRGELPENVPALSRVVRVGDRAWSVDLVKERGLIETGDLRIRWSPGQASALDSARIEVGADVGNIVVERKEDEGWIDAVYSVDFAFAFKAFYADAEIIAE